MEDNITIFITADLNLSNCYLWTPYRELCCYLDKGTVIEPFSCRILLTFRSKCVLRLTTIIYGIAKFEFYLKDWVQRDRKNLLWFAMLYELHLIRCVFNPQVKGLGMKNRKIQNHQRFEIYSQRLYLVMYQKQTGYRRLIFAIKWLIIWNINTKDIWGLVSGEKYLRRRCSREKNRTRIKI